MWPESLIYACSLVLIYTSTVAGEIELRYDEKAQIIATTTVSSMTVLNTSVKSRDFALNHSTKKP